MSTIDEQNHFVSAEDIQQEYRYAVGWARLLLGPPLLAAMAAACIFGALFIDQGVRLWGIVRIPPLVVKVLAGVGAVATGIGAIAGFMDLCSRLTTRQRIALTRTGILVPAGRGVEKLILFESMRRLDLMRAPDTGTLAAVLIESPAGDFTIQQALLPAGALDEIAEELTRRFEHFQRPDQVRHREKFWEEEQRRQEHYEKAGSDARRAVSSTRANKHQILALPFGEVEPKIVATFDTADKAEEYANFLRGSDQYQWVRIEERKTAD